ncbi:peptidoglycan DD-metalloendopeptidase family protein [Mycolicibacterium pulveris]|uniref:Bulb-type lectin domain-containing protein n=1 Tax=Mycolicibacterium pulveris TaxID=36813 RepID=A0A7I7UL18_MYCPV|nr:Ig-like domain-containing protein [Mycolicibacterium pulveris]MCV6981382.1 peptidoglycan DD-metalloendopeptidase family protein [Mycolicibacterium pulveris]BBY82168.1 hypothetical protein MPUL_33260 [Mycolicibacterium pulveris]
MASSPAIAFAEPDKSTTTKANDASVGADSDAPESNSTEPTSTPAGDGSSDATDASSADPRDGIVQSSGGAQTGTYGGGDAAADGEEEGEADISAEKTVSDTTNSGDQESDDGSPSNEEHFATPDSVTQADKADGADDSGATDPLSTAQNATENSVPSGALEPSVSAQQAPSPAAEDSLVDDLADSQPSTVSAFSTPQEDSSGATSVPVAPAAAASPISIVTDLVSGFLGLIGLGPAATNAPAAPVQSPTLWTLLAWVRRQIEYTLFNGTPTIGYDSALNSQSEDGIITGDLAAHDSDGDPLGFSVAEGPANGSVVIHPDGIFTYTPNEAFAASGGEDTFTVMVSDAGAFHMHGLFGLFQPGQGHSSTAQVTVTVTPVDQNHGPIADPEKITRTPGDPSTGVVTGSLGISDPEGDALRYTVVTGPANGTVTIDSATGTYTYTPSTAARLIAGLPTPSANVLSVSAVETSEAPGAAFDSFTVSVTDGLNAPVTIVVDSVPVSPLETDIGIPVAYQPSPAFPASIEAGPDGRGYVLDGYGKVHAVAPDGSVLWSSPLFSDGDMVVVGASPSDSMAVSPDGSRLYVAKSSQRIVGTDVVVDGSVLVIDTSSGALIDTISVGQSAYAVTAAPDGSLYVTGADVEIGDEDPVYTWHIRVFDPAEGTPIGDPIPVGGMVLAITVSPDGRYVYYVGGEESSPSGVTVFDTVTGVKTPIGPSGGVAAGIPSLRPDGKQMYLMGGSVVVDTDPTSPTYLDVVHVAGPELFGGYVPIGVAAGFSADSSVAYIPVASYGEDNQPNGWAIAAVDTVDFGLIELLPVGVMPTGIAMSSNGQQGYVINSGVDLTDAGAPPHGTVSVIIVGPVGNYAPTARIPAFKTVNVDSATGIVTGTMNVNDADGDPLTYELTSGIDPAIGTVTVDSATGMYVFTPTKQARQNAYKTAGPDTVTFTVTASDGQASVAVDVTAAISALDPPPPPPPPIDDRLTSGEQLKAGQYIESKNGRYRLYMQKDGNLVLYDEQRSHKALWASATDGQSGAHAVMQSDGNLVVYRGSKALWSSHTNGQKGAVLVVQNDGNLVIYKGSTAAWDRHAGVLVPPAPPPSTGKMARPLTSYTVTSEYGAGRNHTGIDLAAPAGREVYAAADGVIWFEGWGTSNSPGQRSNWMGDAAGISILIQHDSLGVYTGYAHLSQTVIDIGQVVKKGQLIGKVGCTTRVSGGCTGPHLHFEVLPMPLSSSRGIYGRVNPRNYLSF